MAFKAVTIMIAIILRVIIVVKSKKDEWPRLV